MRRIHNFQIVASIDGRENIISAGPKSSDGGFRLTIYMREKGEILNAVEIQGRVRDMGKALVLKVDGTNVFHYIKDNAKGEFTIITER